MPPKINKDDCVGCGACVDACPNQALELIDDIAVLTKPDKCKDAWACVESCPTGACIKPE